MLNGNTNNNRHGIKNKGKDFSHINHLWSMFINTVCTSKHLFNFKKREVSGSADDISINVLEEGQSSDLRLDLRLRRECVCIILNRPLCELLCSTITAVLAVLLASFSDSVPWVFRSALAGSSRTHPLQDTMSTGLKLRIASIKAGCLPFIRFTGKRSWVFRLFVTTVFSQDKRQMKTEDKLLRPPNLNKSS